VLCLRAQSLTLLWLLLPTIVPVFGVFDVIVDSASPPPPFHRASRILRQLSAKTKLSLKDLSALAKEFTETSSATGEMSQEQFMSMLTTKFPVIAKDEAMLGQLFKVMDNDANSTVTFEEFAIGWAKLVSGSLDTKLELLFNVYDSDGGCHRPVRVACLLVCRCSCCTPPHPVRRSQ